MQEKGNPKQFHILFSFSLFFQDTKQDFIWRVNLLKTFFFYFFRLQLSMFCWTTFTTLALTRELSSKLRVSEWVKAVHTACCSFFSSFLFLFHSSFAPACILSFSRVLKHFRGWSGGFSFLKYSWAFLFTSRERENTQETSFPLFLTSLPFCVGGQWEGVIVCLDFAGVKKKWERQSMNVCVSQHMLQKRCYHVIIP